MLQRKPTVLVVDDEDMVRCTVVAMFEDFDFEVIAADCGERALELLAERHDIGLLFTDCRMPGMSGQELARVAARRDPKLKIVFSSGYTDEVPEGPWPLLAKPYRSTELLRVLETLCARG